MATVPRQLVQGRQAPSLIVLHYPEGEEKHINTMKDVFLLVTPTEGCCNGDLGEMQDMLEYANSVVAMAHHPKEVPIAN